MHKAEREKFFGQRIYWAHRGLQRRARQRPRPELKPSPRWPGELEGYVEMLVALRGRFHRQYITECMTRS